MEMRVQMVNVPVLRMQGGECIPTAIYSYVCVSLAAFEFSVSTVYVNGHVGFSGVVVTLT